MGLAERQITAKDSVAGSAEGFGKRDEQRGLAVGASAMGEDDAIRSGLGCAMQEAADGEIGG
jgi:hypothetical protein